MGKKSKKRKRNMALTIVAGTAGGVLASAVGHLMADGFEQYLNKGGKERLRQLMHDALPRRASTRSAAEARDTRTRNGAKRRRARRTSRRLPGSSAGR